MHTKFYECVKNIYYLYHFYNSQFHSSSSNNTAHVCVFRMYVFTMRRTVKPCERTT